MRRREGREGRQLWGPHGGAIATAACCCCRIGGGGGSSSGGGDGTIFCWRWVRSIRWSLFAFGRCKAAVCIKTYISVLWWVSGVGCVLLECVCDKMMILLSVREEWGTLSRDKVVSASKTSRRSLKYAIQQEGKWLIYKVIIDKW